MKLLKEKLAATYITVTMIFILVTILYAFSLMYKDIAPDWIACSLFIVSSLIAISYSQAIDFCTRISFKESV